MGSTISGGARAASATLGKYAPRVLESLSKWWVRQSRLAQFGYVSLGTYVATAAIARYLRKPIDTASKLIQPLPMDVRSVYGYTSRHKPQYGAYNTGINSNFGSPVNLGGVVDSGTRRANASHTNVNLTPTAGIVQQSHRDRIGHTAYGAGRTRDQWARLFNIG